MGMNKLKLFSAPLAALLLAGTACHTEQRQAKLPAPQANAPALTAAVPPAPAAVSQKAADPQPMTSEPAATTLQPKPDPVDELVANAEKEYQGGRGEIQGRRPGSGQAEF